jgi:hypothetical protein
MRKQHLRKIFSLTLMFLSINVYALDPEIRMYKMTHDGHSVKYTLLGMGDNPGCHNTPYRYKVYKVAVIAYKSCSVFSAKDCQPDSILPVYWKQKDKPATEMKPGTRWFLALDASEVGVSSWSCNTGLPDNP